MQTVDEEEIETIHFYLVRDAAPKPPLLPIFLSAVALSLLVAFCATAPTEQPVTRAVIRVPAVLLPLKTFTVHADIIPTGVKVYPATTAHGFLTITNGSVISQTLPAGFIFMSNSSVSVATDNSVFVPAGSANGYGYATVTAHALTGGSIGNIPALAVDTVEGSSIYIRNVAEFQGGRDAYSVKFATPQDTQTALIQARNTLTVQSAGLHYPCVESSNGAVRVTWRCQFATYHIPAFYHVTGIKIIGKNLLVAVWFVVRPVRIWVK